MRVELRWVFCAAGRSSSAEDAAQPALAGGCENRAFADHKSPLHPEAGATPPARRSGGVPIADAVCDLTTSSSRIARSLGREGSDRLHAADRVPAFTARAFGSC